MFSDSRTPGTEAEASDDVETALGIVTSYGYPAAHKLSHIHGNVLTSIFCRNYITNANICEYNHSGSTVQVAIRAVSEKPLSNTQRSYPVPDQSQIPHLKALSMGEC